MAAKLCAPNTLSDHTTARSMLPRPVEIRISVMVMARQRVWEWRICIQIRRSRLFEWINVVLQAITGHEGLHGSLAPNAARNPGHLDADPSQIAGVSFARRSAGNNSCPLVNRALIARTGQGIIVVRERGRDEPWLIDLVPPV